MNGKKHKISESRKCCFVLFLMAGLIVLRCFEIPLTEAEPRKGRELFAKRGEQKIKKNQVQAIRHSLVATSRIVGPRLPRHQQSLGTFSYKFKLSSQLCREHVAESVSRSRLFVGERNGQVWWFGWNNLILFGSELQSLEGLIWEASEGMVECWHVVPGWNDEGKEEAHGREEDIWRIEGPKMCPIINRHRCCWGIDIVHHSATCLTNWYD